MRTTFIARIRTSPQAEKTTADGYEDDALYAVCANKSKNSVYVTSKAFTGKFLNSKPFMREDFNNKFLSNDNTAAFTMDSVFDELTS